MEIVSFWQPQLSLVVYDCYTHNDVLVLFK